MMRFSVPLEVNRLRSVNHRCLLKAMGRGGKAENWCVGVLGKQIA